MAKRVVETMLVLVVLLAERVSAQGDSTFEWVLALNRKGEWAEAARVAQQFLAVPLASLNSRRTCRLREQLVYARTRLGQRDAALGALAAFDAECSDVGIDPGFAAELSQ